MNKPRINFEIEQDIKRSLQIEALRRGVTIKELVTKMILNFLKSNR